MSDDSKLQLKLVEEALSTDPYNHELLELRAEIQEVIKLESEVQDLDKTSGITEVGTQNSSDSTVNSSNEAAEGVAIRDRSPIDPTVGKEPVISEPTFTLLELSLEILNFAKQHPRSEPWPKEWIDKAQFLRPKTGLKPNSWYPARIRIPDTNKCTTVYIPPPYYSDSALNGPAKAAEDVLIRDKSPTIGEESSVTARTTLSSPAIAAESSAILDTSPIDSTVDGESVILKPTRTFLERSLEVLNFVRQHPPDQPWPKEWIDKAQFLRPKSFKKPTWCSVRIKDPYINQRIRIKIPPPYCADSTLNSSTAAAEGVAIRDRSPIDLTVGEELDSKLPVTVKSTVTGPAVAAEGLAIRDRSPIDPTVGEQPDCKPPVTVKSTLTGPAVAAEGVAIRDRSPIDPTVGEEPDCKLPVISEESRARFERSWEILNFAKQHPRSEPWPKEWIDKAQFLRPKTGLKPNSWYPARIRIPDTNKCTTVYIPPPYYSDSALNGPAKAAEDVLIRDKSPTIGEESSVIVRTTLNSPAIAAESSAILDTSPIDSTVDGESVISKPTRTYLERSLEVLNFVRQHPPDQPWPKEWIDKAQFLRPKSFKKPTWCSVRIRDPYINERIRIKIPPPYCADSTLNSSTAAAEVLAIRDRSPIDLTVGEEPDCKLPVTVKSTLTGPAIAAEGVAIRDRSPIDPTVGEEPACKPPVTVKSTLTGPAIAAEGVAIRDRSPIDPTVSEEPDCKLPVTVKSTLTSPAIAAEGVAIRDRSPIDPTVGEEPDCKPPVTVKSTLTGPAIAAEGVAIRDRSPIDPTVGEEPDCKPPVTVKSTLTGPALAAEGVAIRDRSPIDLTVSEEPDCKLPVISEESRARFERSWEILNFAKQHPRSEPWPKEWIDKAQFLRPKTGLKPNSWFPARIRIPDTNKCTTVYIPPPYYSDSALNGPAKAAEDVVIRDKNPTIGEESSVAVKPTLNGPAIAAESEVIWDTSPVDPSIDKEPERISPVISEGIRARNEEILEIINFATQHPRNQPWPKEWIDKAQFLRPKNDKSPTNWFSMRIKGPNRKKVRISIPPPYCADSTLNSSTEAAGEAIRDRSPIGRVKESESKLSTTSE